MEENSIDSIVTDPPYGLKFMGKKWDYNVPSVEIWREALRVLKPGGHLLSFGGTRTYHRMVVNIEDAGFEIRDQIQWIYGSGFPKSHNLKGEWQGWGTALKPANEPIVVARKPLYGTVAENVLKYGTGAMNINGSRIKSYDPIWFTPETDKQCDSIMVFKEKTGAGSDSMFKNKGGRSGSTLGRWLSNIILDEQAAEMLDSHSGISKSSNKQRNNKPSDNRSMSGPNTGHISFGHNDSGGASRFFYCAKASNSERNKGLEVMPEIKCGLFEDDNYAIKTGSGNLRDTKRQNFHPTVKPIKLMEYLCKLITPPKGIILDPFMGSGSTGVASKNLGFKFIGIEMNEDYFKIAKARCKEEKNWRCEDEI